MTDRLIACLLLLSLLAMQTLSGLHAGSRDIGRPLVHHAEGSHESMHQTLFGALENRAVSPHPQQLARLHSPEDINSPASTTEHASNKHYDVVCDLLDQMLHAPGFSSVCAGFGDAATSIGPPEQSTPARLSRFLRLGPPARGPPVLEPV